MGNLLTRLRHAGVLLLIGFLVIIYIALGILYLQQGARQRGLEEQITKASLIVSKPMPSAEKLQAECDEINRSLSSMPMEAILEKIVGMASESGIDVNPDSDKLHIPPATIKEETVGEGSYQVLSFKNIKVQGDYDSVMAFISDLDSGKTLETMVLKKVATSQIEVKGEGEEETKTETAATLDVDLYTKLEE